MSRPEIAYRVIADNQIWVLEYEDGSYHRLGGGRGLLTEALRFSSLAVADMYRATRAQFTLSVNMTHILGGVQVVVGQVRKERRDVPPWVGYLSGAVARSEIVVQGPEFPDSTPRCTARDSEGTRCVLGYHLSSQPHLAAYSIGVPPWGDEEPAVTL